MLKPKQNQRLIHSKIELMTMASSQRTRKMKQRELQTRNWKHGLQGKAIPSAKRKRNERNGMGMILRIGDQKMSS